MTDIVWETPPTPRTGPAGHLRNFASALREHPGEWARYPRPLTPAAASATSTRINAGIGSFGPVGDFEAVTRTVDGERVLYVRYVGVEAGAA